MSKDQILDNISRGIMKQFNLKVFKEDYPSLHKTILASMDEHAKNQAIEFFKWYGVKMIGFIEYITTVKPLVKSEEIEEKIMEFEGKSFEELYDLFIQSQQNKQS